jgi:hypothetical protein
MSGFGDLFMNTVAAASGTNQERSRQEAREPSFEVWQEDQLWGTNSTMTYHAITEDDVAAAEPSQTEAPATPAGMGIAREECLCTADVAEGGTSDGLREQTGETTPVRLEVDRAPAVGTRVEMDNVASLHRRLDRRPVKAEQTRKEVGWQQRAGATSTIPDKFRDEVLAGGPQLHLFVL